MEIKKVWLEKLQESIDKLYGFKTIKAIPSKWTEENIILTRDVSRFSGKFSYDLSPYAREIIDNLHPKNPFRTIAVMKGAQSGITQGVIVPGMAWIISENPDNFLFTASDKEIAKKTINTRFDPLMRSSGLQDLIRPNAIRKSGQRSGDTDFSKEFAGGSAIIEGTNNAGKFRFFSVRNVFMDDFDNAPKADKVEGSIRELVKGRQTSYGNLAKTFYVSTPTITQTSNIYEVYEEGDKRKWHWTCPSCKEWMPSDWRIKREDGSYGGIVWELNEKDELIEESVAFECPHCRHRVSNNDKHELNKNGKWIATAKPKDRYTRSYYMNSLIIPPGFITWVDMVNEWLKACPPGRKPVVRLLKVFNNVRLGIPFEEKGEVPTSIQIMSNTREYQVGVVPDITCEADGNGQIVMISIACDLNGAMDPGAEDVRLDYEVMAHTSNGQTYSIDQGSIGTFKRTRDRSKLEKARYFDREKWTYMHGVKNSVWPEFDKIIRKEWPCESGKKMIALVSVVDTGFFTRLAKDFINMYEGTGITVIGLKGDVEADYRRSSKDTPHIKRSREGKNLYLVQVNQMKDDLAQYMKLRPGVDGSQPAGFMNFPQPSEGKYTPKGFFIHFEGEKRIEDVKNGDVVGFKWVKRTSQSQNHFLDTRLYNNAVPAIYIDLVRRSGSQYKDFTWADFVNYMLA